MSHSYGSPVDQFWRFLFNPNSVAMVGASDVPGSWGFNIMQRLIHTKGRRIYAVNPSHPTVAGMSTYKRVVDIPDEIELAVIAVPAARVPPVMRDCVEKGITAAVVISGGFAEADDQGVELQREILDIARQGGMRFVGPNTMGHANNHAHFSILGFTGKVFTGPVSFAAQSGNMGSRIMQLGNSQGVGFSKFVCTGNEATVRLEDYLEYFAQDDDTKAIVFYIEGLREAKRFLKLAKETTVKKPIVVMKSGSTKGAMQAARSHTGALAGSDEVYSAAFKQTGVIRAETEDEVADVLTGLVKQPLPKGNRIAILTMGGGYGVVAAEACEKEGLQMASLSPTTIARLDSMLPARWPHGNPVDLAGMDTMGDSTVMQCLETLLEDEGVDALISLVGLTRSTMMPPGLRAPDKSITEARDQKLREFSSRAMRLGKTVLSVGHIPMLMPGSQTEDSEANDFALFSGPQRAARALHHMLWYHNYLEEAGRR